MKNKNVLLIGGGGTLGTYTAQELLRKGCFVDVICLEDKVSDNINLCFHKANADLETLKAFLKDRYYDGIVNFIHYLDVEDYKPVHRLLSAKTEHLIFLSSYRVYADLQHPITEEAPLLLDVLEDKLFHETEKYAASKTRCERFLREESGTDNWTVVRPVISFSENRLDLVCRSGHDVLRMTENGQTILLPEKARNLTAGLEWAGNSGKLIANLLFKKETLREAYTVSGAQNLTWGEAADIYTDLIGAKFQWVDTDKYIENEPKVRSDPFILKYDRLFDRKIDNSKILKATGLKASDFVPIRDGIKTEIEKIKNKVC